MHERVVLVGGRQLRRRIAELGAKQRVNHREFISGRRLTKIGPVTEAPPHTAARARAECGSDRGALDRPLLLISCGRRCHRWTPGAARSRLSPSTGAAAAQREADQNARQRPRPAEVEDRHGHIVSNPSRTVNGHESPARARHGRGESRRGGDLSPPRLIGVAQRGDGRRSLRSARRSRTGRTRSPGRRCRAYLGIRRWGLPDRSVREPAPARAPQSAA